MSTNETPTPRTDAYIGDKSAVVLTAGEEAMCEFARTLERELENMRSAFDKQCSVTLGQMQTIRELRERVGSAEAAMMSQHSVILERDNLRRQVDAQSSSAIEQLAITAEMQDRALKAEADGALLKEQIRVADVAFNGLNDRHNKAEAALAAKDTVLRAVEEFCSDNPAEADGGSSEVAALRGAVKSALSPDAGKGWLSPKEAEKLRGENMTLQINLDGSKGMSRLMREQRDAWREAAENLAQFIPVKNNPAGQAALAAHDALVAKEGGK